MRLMANRANEFYRYLLVGIGSNCINFLVYFLAKVFFSFFVAAFCGYVAGLFISYHFGRIWVFGERFSIKRQNIIGFLIVYSIGGLGMSGLIEFFCEFKGVDFRISWLIGAIFAFVNNFLGMKLFVFRRGI